MAHALNAQTKEIGNWSIIYDALMFVPEIEYYRTINVKPLQTRFLDPRWKCQLFGKVFG